MRRVLITNASHPAIPDIIETLAADGWETILWEPDEDISVLKERVSRGGALDGILISDRYVYRSSIEDQDNDRFKDAFMSNAKRSFLVAKHISPLINEGGAVLYLSSVFADKPTGCSTAYSTAQAAVCMMFKELALFYGHICVRFNTIKLGPFPEEDKDFDSLISPFNYDAVSKIPLGRRINPKDVSATVAFLLSAAAGYINGAELVVDGGQRMYYADREWKERGALL